MIGIVVSRADAASERTGDAILDRGDWTPVGDDQYRTAGFELRYYDELHLHLEGVASDFDDPDFLVFVSRHSGETGALLSTHFTGNFGDAEYGGADRSVAPACPNAQHAALRALDAYAPDDYDVTLECTHHGPTDPGAPAMFVELGSGPDQWRDPGGANAVAAAVLELAGVDAHTPRTVVAFAGGHYAPRPTRIVRETDWACGHIAADWCLDDLGTPGDNLDVLDQVFERSEAAHAVIQGEYPELTQAIESLGYRVVSETWLRETDRVPLGLVERLEADLSTVDGGLRFGTAPRIAESGRTNAESKRTNAESKRTNAESECADYELRSLPRDLLADANGMDTDAVTDAARETSVAYETVENGARVAGRAAFEAESDYDEFIDQLCRVLDRRFETVERSDGEIIARETAFDPEAAAALGVPEGPAFGQLASGESVKIDDRTIHPDDVTAERTRRYTR